MKLVCLVIAALPIGAAGQNQAEYLTESFDGNMVFSYRPDRTRRDGDTYSIWIFGNTKRPTPVDEQKPNGPKYTSYAANWNLNCRSGTYALYSESYYSASGAVVGGGQRNPYAQARPVPDTVGDGIMRAVCLRLGQPAP